MSPRALRANPYVGLRPFFIEDSLYFYGREQQTEELLAILRRNRFLGVVGGSGSGKSSLVRAGLLPALLGGSLVEDRDRWRRVQIKPGDAPIENLAAGLLEAMGDDASPADVARLADDIREDHTDAVTDFLGPRLGSDANLLLLVDQFEEIFAFRGSGEGVEGARRHAEATAFVDLLLQLARRLALPVYVVLTMRTDFLGDCDLFFGLPEALNVGRYLVPRMSREQLRSAVEAPARLKGAPVAARLSDHVLNELGDRMDRLPVLQHALMRTWDAWRAAGGIGPIDLEHFEAAGGLEDALNRDADRALDGLDEAVVARVFRRLTDTDVNQRRVRSPARLSELVGAVAPAGADPDQVEALTTEVTAIIERFESDGRSFLNRAADGRPDDPRVDISHEALIRQWGRLQDWVDEEQRSRDQYLDMTREARKWEALNRDPGVCLRNPELPMIVGWMEAERPTPGWASRYARSDEEFPSVAGYIQVSVDAERRALAAKSTRDLWARFEPALLILLLIAGVSLGIYVKFPDFIIDYTYRKGDGVLNVFGFLLDPRLFFISCFGIFSIWFHRVVKSRFNAFVTPRVFNRTALNARGSGSSEPETRDARDVHPTTLGRTWYATAWQRFWAFLIDFFVLIVFSIILLFGEDKPLEGLPDDVSTTIYFTEIIIFFWLYYAIQICSKRQATLGMRVMRIFRTRMHGEKLSFAQASAVFGYWLVSWLFYGLPFLILPFMARKQAGHDLMTETLVLWGRPGATLTPGKKRRRAAARELGVLAPAA